MGHTEKKDPEKINVFLCMCFYVCLFLKQKKVLCVFMYKLLKEEKSGKNLKH